MTTQQQQLDPTYAQGLSEGFKYLYEVTGGKATDGAIQILKQFFQPLHQSSHCIFLACFPKSASTYLSQLISRITGFPHKYFFALGSVGSEQNLDLIATIDGLCSDSIVQQHLPPQPINLRRLKEFSIKPVILTRNLFDIVPSIRDEIVEEGDFYRQSYTYANILDLPSEDQLDAIICYAIPFYLQFFAGWTNVQRTNAVDTLWFDYKEVTRDTFNTVKKIFAYHGLDYPDEVIQDAIDYLRENREGTNFNKGVSGRGELLSDKQKDRIREMAWHFRDVDFSPIGLE